MTSARTSTSVAAAVRREYERIHAGAAARRDFVAPGDHESSATHTPGGVEGHDWTSLRGPAGVVHDLVVDPAQRGQGVGTQLLEATVATLEAAGAPRIVLWTAERNAGAQRLFARAGFRRTMVEMTREVEDADRA